MSKKNRLQQKESNEKKDKSSHVEQREKISYDLLIKERNDYTDKQKELIDLILDKKTKIIFLSGPAGTAKTHLSVLAGLKLIKSKSLSDLLYIRSVIESANKSLGTLPGDSSEKLHPFTLPLLDKLEELLSKFDIDRLQKENRIQSSPVNYLRGASFNAKFIFCDEAQNFDIKELTTILTRIGKFSKLIIAGDPMQSDLNGRSGFMKMYDLFNDESSRNEGIHCFSFTKDDIVRSGILKYIIEKIENGNAILK